MRRRKRLLGPTIIVPNPTHPLGWDNPANEWAWRELARAIGRKIADDQAAGLIGEIEGQDDDDQRPARPLPKCRSVKRPMGQRFGRRPRS